MAKIKYAGPEKRAFLRVSSRISGLGEVVRINPARSDRSYDVA